VSRCYFTFIIVATFLGLIVGGLLTVLYPDLSWRDAVVRPEEVSGMVIAAPPAPLELAIARVMSVRERQGSNPPCPPPHPTPSISGPHQPVLRLRLPVLLRPPVRRARVSRPFRVGVPVAQ
jgi:hypothetical protein